MFQSYAVTAGALLLAAAVGYVALMALCYAVWTMMIAMVCSDRRAEPETIGPVDHRHAARTLSFVPSDT